MIGRSHETSTNVFQRIAQKPNTIVKGCTDTNPLRASAFGNWHVTSFHFTYRGSLCRRKASSTLPCTVPRVLSFRLKPVCYNLKDHAGVLDDSRSIKQLTLNASGSSEYTRSCPSLRIFQQASFAYKLRLWEALEGTFHAKMQNAHLSAFTVLAMASSLQLPNYRKADDMECFRIPLFLIPSHAFNAVVQVLHDNFDNRVDVVESKNARKLGDYLRSQATGLLKLIFAIISFSAQFPLSFLFCRFEVAPPSEFFNKQVLRLRCCVACFSLGSETAFCCAGICRWSGTNCKSQNFGCYGAFLRKDRVSLVFVAVFCSHETQRCLRLSFVTTRPNTGPNYLELYFR